jgi:hypothetical protein
MPCVGIPYRKVVTLIYDRNPSESAVRKKKNSYFRMSRKYVQCIFDLKEGSPGNPPMIFPPKDWGIPQV